MTDAQNKSPGVVFWGIVTLVVLMFLYPLSIGPVAWLVDREMLPEGLSEPLGIVYLPLEYAVAMSNTTMHLYAWYVSLWMREPYSV